MTEANYHQVAYVVKDVDAAVRHWADSLGVGPWSVYTMGADRLTDPMYRGQEVSFGIRHALGWSGTMQFELVQPLEGPSIFADQLATTGPGLNHVARMASDHEHESASLIALGYVPLQSARFGKSGDGMFAYFESPIDGTILELIQPPTVRFAPDYIYPAPEA